MSGPISARRGFIKASCLALGGSLLPGLAGAGTRQGITNALRVGLVGCGGRGTGAAAEALHSDPHTELVAVADVDASQIEKCLGSLRSISRIAGQVKVSGQFVDLNGYEKVIAHDVDLVLLATPPGFRPVHLAACVNAGKHIFCEKPVATDAFGVRSVLESAKKAKAKNLSLVGGLCWRYSPIAQQMFQSISQGVIGRVVSYNATYFGNSVRPMPSADSRPANMSDTEWQIRNWYNFVWLSGDGLVEQAIHSADRIAWAMHDTPPLDCVGTGGRVVPSYGGNIYDHFGITYNYPGGVQAFLNARQIDGCADDVSDYIVGSEGTCTFGHGTYPVFQGKNKWSLGNQLSAAADSFMNNTGNFGERIRNHAQGDIYQLEQNALTSSIRNGKPLNDGNRMATSTMLVIMGRLAAYTGQKVTWEQAFGSQEQLVPEKLDWTGKLPVAPRAQPGITKLL